MRFEQPADQVFDLPVTVTLTCATGGRATWSSSGTEAGEQTIRTDGPVRQVQMNRDYAALAKFEEREAPGSRQDPRLTTNDQARTNDQLV